MTNGITVSRHSIYSDNFAPGLYRLLNYLVLIVEYPVAYGISILLSVEDITRISGIYSFTYSAVSK